MNKVLDLKPPEPIEESPAQAQELEAAELPMDGEEEEYISESFAEPQIASWQAHHPLSERGWYRHYIVLSGFGLVGASVAFWQGSWLTLAVIVLGLGAWEIHERMAHPVKVTVDDAGVWVNGRRFPHADLTSFDIHRMADGTSELSLQTKQWHVPHLRLPLGEQDAEELWRLISRYVPQEAHPIPRLDHWLRS